MKNFHDWLSLIIQIATVVLLAIYAYLLLRGRKPPWKGR